MEKGVDFADLEQFVIVPERPRLWILKTQDGALINLNTIASLLLLMAIY